MKTIVTVLAVLLVLAAALLAVVWSGAYDAAASQPDWAPVARLLETAKERSIERHAAGIRVPPLSDPALLRTGLVHYREMCVTCHGGPGVQPSEIGQGLNPYPPELAGEAHEYSEGELYWIVKNGLRMTGMPAFGNTHEERELWAIVAFVERLPKLTPQEYAAMVRDAGLETETESDSHEPGEAEPGPGHHHEPGTPAHHHEPGAPPHPGG